MIEVCNTCFNHQLNPGFLRKPVGTKCQAVLDFAEARDDGGGISPPPTYQQTRFIAEWMPFLSPNQQPHNNERIKFLQLKYR